MKVYRLEYRGWGVFNASGISPRWVDDALYKDYGCTVGGVWGDSSYRFGCRTVDKLVEYFGSDFAYLLDKGATLVEYEVKRRHVVFSPKGIEIAFKFDEVVERVIIYKRIEVQCKSSK